MFFILFRLKQFLSLFLIIAMLPSCMHSFRISPERAMNQAHDLIVDVHAQFGAAFEISAEAPQATKEKELQSHAIMTMQEIGQRSKNFLDRWLDIDHEFERFPFVHYQKLIDLYVERLISAQKHLVSSKYSEGMAHRMHARISALEDEIGDCICQLKSVRTYIVSHDRYWQEKEKLEKREHERRELMLKKERNEIEKEKLFIEREKMKLKDKKSDKKTSYNSYDVTIVEYYE